MQKNWWFVSFLFIFCLFGRSTGLFADQSEAPLISPEQIASLHDVVFGQGGGRDLHAEIAYPNGAKAPLPAIIYIHGGGWVGGSQHDSYLPVAKIAQHGYFVASIEYRLSKEAKWPAQIEDCKLAVRWLRANATKYNVNPNRIGAWGDSAGGHLVACLGTMADQKQYEGAGGYPDVSSAVQAVVDFYGPTDFTRPDIYSPQAAWLTQGLFGMPYDKDPEVWKSGSPLYFVKPDDPPMLLVHGDADVLVPLAQSTVFDEALTKAGVPHQLLIVKNAGHVFGPKPGTAIDPSREEIEKAVFAFLAKHLQAP
ncbi:MAG: alpha/beta hydrolase [Methylacidiphilales bacterium]|nr:alpha/beta hydrolase [Candidatus Methylacidiphilales bacterium]